MALTPPFSIPNLIAELYYLRPIDFEFLTRVQNTVFTFQKHGHSFVLRLTPESHRSFAQVKTELDWVSDLDASGISVAGIVPAENGCFANQLEVEGIRYTAVAFKKVPGQIGASVHWNSETFRTWGKVMGQMHRAAITYRPSENRRTDWKEQLPLSTVESTEEIQAQAKLRELVARLDLISASDHERGLIHSDLHFWNFSVDDGRITVFDFDNSEYHWFLADLGTVIFEASTCIFQKLPRQEFILTFLRDFLAGYHEEHHFGTVLQHLPEFVKLREIQIFLILSKRWKGRELNPFQQRFFSTMQESVLHDTPFLEESTLRSLLNG